VDSLGVQSGLVLLEDKNLDEGRVRGFGALPLALLKKLAVMANSSRISKSFALVLILGMMLSVQAQTLNPASDFIIGPQVPIPSPATSWFDQTEITFGKKWGALCGTPPAVTDPAFNDYILRQYYDLPLTEYIAYKRTGDPTFLTYAQKCADEWWQNPQWIGSGSIRLWTVAGNESASPPPRHGGVGGLILRALDGHPEMWDWINSYVRFSLNNWLKNHINDPSLYYGVREGAFALHYATWLAKVLPDSFPLQAGGIATNGATLRSQYLADVEAITVSYFGRLQHSDGSWRWDDPDFIDPDGGHLVGIMQPFMVGLLLNAEIDVHRLTTSTAVKASIQSQLTKALTVLYNSAYRKNEPTTITGVSWNSFWYVIFGGTTVNPTKYQTGGGSYLNADIATQGSWVINNERQATSTIFSAYAYAYLLTGDITFKNMGDDVSKWAIGNVDGFHDFADADAKGYNQNYRMGGRYAAWIAMENSTSSPSPSPTPASSPTPTPVPSPSPSPSPSPTPTPTPTPVPTPTVIAPLNSCAIGQWCSWAWPSSQQSKVNTLNNAVGYGCDRSGPWVQTGSYVYCMRVR
jgi:hypothetical protein